MSNFTPNRQTINLESLFPFSLDQFQLDAIAALNAGKSVVVCAPTGSGKTLIGEYAIHRALANGHRVFYTTPLKALSNQKLRDFREQFGGEMVGLLTGDLSLNRDAPILVMTTEIFRNMLYGTPIGQVGTSLEGVEAVVLDECHYMNDRQRGTVWEESIIYCPPDVQLLALSATVANSDQLTDWIGKVHGPTELIYSDFRPVPLQFHFCNNKGMFPLLDNTGRKISPKLKERGRRQRGRNRRENVPKLTDILFTLEQRDMLPAIYFIFSRRGCDRSVADVSHLSLVNPEEAKLLRDRIKRFIAETPGAARPEQLEPLSRGIAAHHAGLLPAWKGLVEELFQQGLIKVVFATETLAAGINMPARTTVISSLSKRTDDGHRLLKPSEFLQMAGRAGRRGMDELGHVVTVHTPFEGAKEAAYLATSDADPLVSQFTPSYGMVLNLLQTHTLEEAKNLVERSFGQYLSTLSLVPAELEIGDLENELVQIEAQLGLGDDLDLHTLEDTLANYEKQQERLREEKRLLKTLQKQAGVARMQYMAEAMAFAVLGSIVSLRGKHVPTARQSDSKPMSAVLVAKTPSPGQAPYFLCLGRDNRWYVVAAADVVALHAELPRLKAVDYLDLPENMSFKLGESRRGDEVSESLALQVPEVSVPDIAPEVVDQKARIQEVEDLLRDHPAQRWGKPQKLLKRWRRWQSIQEEIRDRREELNQYLEQNWQEFLNLISILQHFDALDDLEPTRLGQATAALRGDNELWLGLALMSGEFDELEPQNLAGGCAALVTEISRSDSWTNYQLSEGVQEALARLWSLRRSLIKVQGRHRVEFLVLPERREHQRLSAIVEQWASGVEWTELVDNTTLDEGDIVRMLRRTLDFLSQIPHVPHLSGVLKQNAIAAKGLIDRFPVNEDVG